MFLELGKLKKFWLSFKLHSLCLFISLLIGIFIISYAWILSLIDLYLNRNVIVFFVLVSIGYGLLLFKKKDIYLLFLKLNNRIRDCVQLNDSECSPHNLE